MTVDDIIEKWRKEIQKIHDEIDNRKKDFRRSYLLHVGTFLKTLDYFSRSVLPSISETVGDTPIEDLNNVIETRFRTIKEIHKFLIYKADNKNKEEDEILELIIIDVATSINYFGCTPLVVTSDKIESAKTYPLVIKERKDKHDPIVILANPDLAKNFILTPLVGHEIAHLLGKEYKNEKKKNYIEELFCDYFASVVFGVSFLKAVLVNLSRKPDIKIIYNLSDVVHPPLEYRISSVVSFLDKRIDGRIDKQIKQALEQTKKEWKETLLTNTAPLDYDTDLNALNITQLDAIAQKNVNNVLKENNIDLKKLIHNKHQTECPLSLIHANSINFIVKNKEIKNVKFKISHYLEK